MSSKWSGKWRGKGRDTYTNDGKKAVTPLDFEVEIIQQSDLIIIRLPKQQNGTELKLDPLNPNVAIFKDNNIRIEQPNYKSTGKREVVLTLKDGKIHCQTKHESKAQSRANEKDLWGKESVVKSESSLEFDRVQ